MAWGPPRRLSQGGTLASYSAIPLASDMAGKGLASYAALMDIELIIAQLGSRFDADETGIAERLLREFTGAVPDDQLIEQIGLAIAIHRRQRATK